MEELNFTRCFIIQIILGNHRFHPYFFYANVGTQKQQLEACYEDALNKINRRLLEVVERPIPYKFMVAFVALYVWDKSIEDNLLLEDRQYIIDFLPKKIFMVPKNKRKNYTSNTFRIGRPEMLKIVGGLPTATK